MPLKTLALDLEGTLISNAVSQFPRPGLYAFLEFCRREVPQLLIYSAVSAERFRDVAHGLLNEGYVPVWFPYMTHLHCTGSTKDLRLVQGAEVETTFLVDDVESYVHPEQRDQWIPIAPFGAPYAQDDRELNRVMEVLRTRLA